MAIGIFSQKNHFFKLARGSRVRGYVSRRGRDYGGSTAMPSLGEGTIRANLKFEFKMIS